MLAVTNGKVVTITGPVYEQGTVLIDGAKITAVGENIEIPQGCKVIDAKGGWITPGLIDCHTHLSLMEAQKTTPGVLDLNEISDPITPHVRALDSFSPYDEAIEIVRNSGFTTCYVLPGSANVIGGVGFALKLRGYTADDMMIPGTEQMKFAFGENPKKVYGLKDKMPVTRMGVAGLMRETLMKAVEYSEELREYENGNGKKPKLDVKLHALVPAVRREMRCRLHCHRADDIASAVRIAKEFNLDYTLEHATEGYKVSKLLAEEGMYCVIGPLLYGKHKRELWGIRLDTPAALEKAGANICLTADEGLDTQHLPVHVGVMMRKGLSEDAAFKSVTINPARLMGLDDRVGSLEVGKDADVAIFNGHPFSNMTECVATVIDGEIHHCML